MINKIQDIETKAVECLERFWGFKTFKKPQLEVIKHVLSGNDSIVLLPTGGGKSICYQIPALLSKNMTIVITPLIALMDDQVGRLQKLGIAAEAIHSGISKKEKGQILERCTHDLVKLLYISPELLQSHQFQIYFEVLNISLVAVDEAHCISQWGFDFRPSYLKIKDKIAVHKTCNKIALSATATNEVLNDIEKYAGLNNPKIFKESFRRSNISISIMCTENKYAQLKDFVQNMKNEKIIIYVRSRKKTEELATHLSELNLPVNFYHAGLTHVQRTTILNGFMDDNIQVICATNAFGMGLDKQNVRAVVHFDVPPSMEEYMQEFGRAGRDGKPSIAKMLINNADLLYARSKKMEKFPSKESIMKVYSGLCKFYKITPKTLSDQSFTFSIDGLSSQIDQTKNTIYHCCRILEKEGHILLFEQKNIYRSAFVKVDIQSVRENKLPPNEKTILLALVRLYEGILESSCKISHSQLSEYTQMNENMVDSVLRSLKRKNWLNYVPQDAGNRIQFPRNSTGTQHLSIDEKSLSMNKKMSLNRLQAVIRYIKTKDCRTMVQLAYFGENMSERCGLCDNCQSHQSKSNEIKRQNQRFLEEGIP